MSDPSPAGRRTSQLASTAGLALAVTIGAVAGGLVLRVIEARVPLEEEDDEARFQRHLKVLLDGLDQRERIREAERAGRYLRAQAIVEKRGQLKTWQDLLEKQRRLGMGTESTEEWIAKIEEELVELEK